jgi:hypothetical protein
VLSLQIFLCVTFLKSVLNATQRFRAKTDVALTEVSLGWSLAH